MKTRLLAGAIALGLTLAACADGEADQAVAVPTGEVTAEAQPTELASIDVKAGTSAIGDILIGPDGLSLYAFTNDIDAVSTCYGTCADAWPPVIVDAAWTAGPGLDFGIFATTVREDGQLQLVAGQWPLYYFAGDGAPGDLKGQGSGDVWFAVDVDGRLITAGGSTPAAADEGAGDGTAEESAADESAADDGATDRAAEASPVAIATTDLGDALVDGAGLTLYGFTNDPDGTPTCNDACADAWPPVIVDGPELPAGLDGNVFSVAERADGTFQLRAGVWPLYRFAGDGAPGDVNGQGSGDVWFVAAPDGSLIRPGAGADESSSGATTDGSRDY